MARADKWMMPYGNPINPFTNRPIFGDPITAIAGIGAAGSLIGGIAGSDASSSAADTQSAAANQATAQQKQMFDTINNQQGPYRDAGYTALSALMNGVGISGQGSQQGGQGAPGVGYGGLTHQFNANDLGTNLSPSYNFMLNQGLGALQNSAAAQGGLVGGNALKGINDYAQNYASNGYQQAYSNYNNNQNNIFSRLSSIAGMGQNANNTTAQSSAAFAPGIASTIQGAGQAQASGIVGSSNNLRQGLNNAQSWYQYGSNPVSGIGAFGDNSSAGPTQYL